MIFPILDVILRIYEELRKPETATETLLAVEGEILQFLNDQLERLKFGG